MTKIEWAVESSFCFCETPIGPLRIAEDDTGITSVSFVDDTIPCKEIGVKGIYLADAMAQLEEYFFHKRTTFDLPLHPLGTKFQQKIWTELQAIPYGETRSYQDIALCTGSPRAARAVGMANNRNPILILIPCHRVVGKDNKLVGYAGGIQRKRYLLDLEGGKI